MKMNGIFGPACLGALSVIFTLSFAHASPKGDEAESSSGKVEESLSTSSNDERDVHLAKLLKEASFSAGVAEVVRMVGSGAETAILIAHVQASDTPYKLRPEDIRYLDENSVPDSVIASMIVRGAEVRAKTPPTPQPVPWVQAYDPSAATKVVYVAAPKYRVRKPVSTVTVIGSSYLGRGSRYGRYSYGSRDSYSGGYGRVYSSYGGYSWYGGYSDYGPSYRRGHGARACR